MDLLAQDPTNVDWVTWVFEKSPYAVMFAMLVFACLKYVPLLVKGHLENLESNRKTNERLSVSYEGLSGTVREIAVTQNEIAKNQTEMAKTQAAHSDSWRRELSELKVLVVAKPTDLDRYEKRHKPDAPHLREKAE